MRYQFQSQFEIGQRVYHNTPEGPGGTIIDISYSVTTNQIKYHLVWGPAPDDDVWCIAEELSHEKIII